MLNRYLQISKGSRILRFSDVEDDEFEWGKQSHYIVDDTDD